MLTTFTRFDSRRPSLHSRGIFGRAMLDHKPLDWGKVDASLATDAELAPLTADDESTGIDVAAPHPNTLWNYGHIHGLENYGPRPLDEWSDEAKRAYANGHRSGVLNRETNERAEASRIQRQHTARDEAYKAGYDAALADAQPSPPVAYSDDLKGSWLDGFAEGNQILIARFNDHLAEEEAKFEYLSLHESATNFGGF